MFDSIFGQLFETLLTFDWASFLAHYREVIDIIVESLKQYFGK